MRTPRLKKAMALGGVMAVVVVVLGFEVPDLRVWRCGFVRFGRGVVLLQSQGQNGCELVCWLAHSPC